MPLPACWRPLQGQGMPSPLLQAVQPGSPWVPAGPVEVEGAQLQESLQRRVWVHLAGSEDGQSHVEQRL